MGKKKNKGGQAQVVQPKKEEEKKPVEAVPAPQPAPVAELYPNKQIGEEEKKAHKDEYLPDWKPKQAQIDNFAPAMQMYTAKKASMS
jgi:hypothetical protein